MHPTITPYNPKKPTISLTSKHLKQNPYKFSPQIKIESNQENTNPITNNQPILKKQQLSPKYYNITLKTTK